jgi:phage FluMu protein Com
MVEMIRCDYCDKLEEVTEYSLDTKIPYYNELTDKIEYDDSCSNCTAEFRAFKLKEKARREKAINE